MRAKITSATRVMLAILVPLLALSGPATAGSNGQISYARFNPAIGDFQVFVANPDGSHEVQLTTAPSRVSDWSPDGSRVAFDYFDGQTDQIGTISPDGTGFVQLTTEENVFHGEPAWSPDGTKLAFDSDAGDHPAGEGIYIMDAVTGIVLSRVTANPYGWFDQSPRWSPDGQWIVFTRFKQVLRMTGITAQFVVRSNGTDLHQLTQWGLNSTTADWSPNGHKIAFNSHSFLPAASNVFTINPDGSGLQVLIKSTGHFATFGMPRWSPDGTKLIVEGTTDARQMPNDLWTVDADGSHLTQLTGITGLLVVFPAWGTHPVQQ
jgi:Tol biopolymer transport system component